MFSLCLCVCQFVCVCVCLSAYLYVRAITFEAVDTETSFFGMMVHLGISRFSSSVKVIGSMSRSYMENALAKWTSVLLGFNCLRSMS